MKYILIMFAVAALAVSSPHPFPGGSQGIGFDDLGFVPMLRKVMVPGGGTGKLALIDPDSQNIEIIDGFSERAGYSGGHGEGITSSDACRGLRPSTIDVPHRATGHVSDQFSVPFA